MDKENNDFLLDEENEDEEIEDIRELLDEGKPCITSLFKNPNSLKHLPLEILGLWDKFVKIPKPEIQLIPLVSYAIAPLPYLSAIPILVCQGLSGTGKSVNTQVIASLWNVELLQGTATSPSAFRNALNNRRFPVPESAYLANLSNDEIELIRFRSKNEQMTCMVFEDLGLKQINEDKFYAILKSGCYRSSDLIELSQGNGKNMKFRCFSPKVISTIHPIYGEGMLQTNELIRRILVCRHEPMESLNLERISDYDWSELQNRLQRFWRVRSNILNFKETKDYLKTLKPKGIPHQYYDLWLDLIVISIISRFYKDTEDALRSWSEYFEFYQDLVSNYKSVFLELLIGFLPKTFSSCDDYLQYIANTQPSLINYYQSRIEKLRVDYSGDEKRVLQALEIKSEIELKKLNEEINKWKSYNLIGYVNPDELPITMATLGWKLSLDGFKYVKE